MAARMASIETKHSGAAASPEEKAAAAMELACARLKSAGLRVTQPRLAILAALVKRAEPASIEQIHAELGRSRCDLVTVYRCMAAFEEIGLVRRAFFLSGTSLFAIELGQGSRYHVLCRQTRRLGDVDPAPSEELTRALEKVEKALHEKGYTELSHIVEFFGVAPPKS
jgi:Fur family ferric uptake transcriptional regulator